MLSTRSQALGVAAALLVWSAPSAMACVDPGLSACTSTYTTDLVGDAILARDAFCPVLQAYHDCVKETCGSIPEDISNFIENAQTHYYECDLNGSGRSTMLSTLLMAVVLLAVRILK